MEQTSFKRKAGELLFILNGYILSYSIVPVTNILHVWYK